AIIAEKQPIEIGSTMLDALIAFAAAHIGNPPGPTPPGSDPKDIETIEEDLLALSTLLLKQEDDPDSQGEAKDMLYEYNFARTDGGTHWYLSGKDPSGRPSQANRAQIG